MSAGFNIEHLKALLADRETFETAYTSVQGNYVAHRAFPAKIVPAHVSKYDMSVHLNPNLPFEIDGDTFDGSAYTKGYKNERNLIKMVNPLSISSDDLSAAEMRGINVDNIIDQNAASWANKATLLLSDTIRGGYGASGLSPVYAKIDDSLSNYLFSTSHEFMGTDDFSNYRSTGAIEEGTSLADAYTYFGNAIEDWENIPDFRGTKGGFGNDFFKNGMVLCSSNIMSTVRQIMMAENISAGTSNIYYNSFRFEVLSELEDGTLIITRDYLKDSRMAGFYIVISDSISTNVFPPGSIPGNLSLRYEDIKYMGVLPTTWQASLLLRDTSGD